MKHRNGYFGRNNKKNDQILIQRIKDLLKSREYKEDKVTATIVGYIERYDKIFSLTDKMRYEIKLHLELHFRERNEDENL
jgi:hypothetical protein